MTASPFDMTRKFIEERLANALEKLEQECQSDVLVFNGQIFPLADDAIREAIEKAHQRQKLTFILTTEGGLIETAERISRILRQHYDIVHFVIPNYAFSAGTVLVMSGDDIFMDYYSVLGPIDPQVKKNGQWVPALGYIEKYNELLAKGQSGNLSQIEAQLFLTHFDQAEMHQYEQARALSIKLLKDWLTKYKFKDWVETESTKQKVTADMKTKRAQEIAEKLNDTKLWHSHSRGIPIDTLEGDDIKLRIKNLKDHQTLHELLRDYDKLLKGYILQFDCSFVCHARGTFQAF